METLNNIISFFLRCSKITIEEIHIRYVDKNNLNFGINITIDEHINIQAINELLYNLFGHVYLKNGKIDCGTIRRYLTIDCFNDDEADINNILSSLAQFETVTGNSFNFVASPIGINDHKAIIGTGVKDSICKFSPLGSPSKLTSTIMVMIGKGNYNIFIPYLYHPKF